MFNTKKNLEEVRLILTKVTVQYNNFIEFFIYLGLQCTCTRFRYSNDQWLLVDSVLLIGAVPVKTIQVEITIYILPSVYSVTFPTLLKVRMTFKKVKRRSIILSM